MTAIKLFYAPGACSLASHIVLEEIGCPFDAVHIDIRNGEQRRPDYLQINPKGRVPALAIDDWVLTENPAILQLLARRFPAAGLWPDHVEQEARAMEWLAWLASTVHIAYAHVRRTDRYATGEAARDDVRAKGIESSRELWQIIERKLGEQSWAMGDQYTVVDPYLLVFWLWGRGPALAFDMTREFPRWSAHARRLSERPAVQRVFAREALELPA